VQVEFNGIITPKYFYHSSQSCNKPLVGPNNKFEENSYYIFSSAAEKK
jgi:hypothetical protein